MRFKGLRTSLQRGAKPRTEEAAIAELERLERAEPRNQRAFADRSEPGMCLAKRALPGFMREERGLLGLGSWAPLFSSGCRLSPAP